MVKTSGLAAGEGFVLLWGRLASLVGGQAHVFVCVKSRGRQPCGGGVGWVARRCRQACASPTTPPTCFPVVCSLQARV